MIGCCQVTNFRAQIITNHRHYMDICERRLDKMMFQSEPSLEITNYTVNKVCKLTNVFSFHVKFSVVACCLFIRLHHGRIFTDDPSWTSGLYLLQLNLYPLKSVDIFSLLSNYPSLSIRFEINRIHLLFYNESYSCVKDIFSRISLAAIFYN